MSCSPRLLLPASAAAACFACHLDCAPSTVCMAFPAVAQQAVHLPPAQGGRGQGQGQVGRRQESAAGHAAHRPRRPLLTPERRRPPRLDPSPTCIRTRAAAAPRGTRIERAVMRAERGDCANAGLGGWVRAAHRVLLRALTATSAGLPIHGKKKEGHDSTNAAQQEDMAHSSTPPPPAPPPAPLRQW